MRGRIGLSRNIILNENSAVWYNKRQHCFLMIVKIFLEMKQSQ